MRWSSTSQPSADPSTGSGCVPWLTCGSCCGSPSSSRLAAAAATAMVLARQNWPASSITSRSRLPGGTRFGLAKSQAVPPITHPVVPVMNPAYSFSSICCHPTSWRSDRFLATRSGSIPASIVQPQQVLHHGMRLRDDADTPAVLGDQPGDDVRGGVGLAGSGRSVHRHVGRIQVEQGGGDVVDGVAASGKVRAAAGPGRAAQQDVEHRGAGELRQPGARPGPPSFRSPPAAAWFRSARPGVSANGSSSKVLPSVGVRSRRTTSVGTLGSSTSMTLARPAARRSGLSVKPDGAGGS